MVVLDMFAQTFAFLGLAPLALAKIQFLGVAIAGGDFGCETDGTCPQSSVQLASDGADQMQHFARDDGMNLFRIPTSWQYLVNDQPGADLDSTNLGKYDQLMQACLDTGAHCMIDIHNFARWNGGIIGQGGPTDAQFVSLWSQLATKYAAQDRVIFELMNEPHDLDVAAWAATCQKAVTAIRQAGATSQMILLPGTDYDSAASLVSSGSAAALLAVTNPDGGTDGLLLDIHKYLDEDNSGTHETCTTNNVAAFTTITQYLRQRGRKGLVAESGASGDASCLRDLCAQNRFLNDNADVIVGFVAWAAGSFDASYALSVTPSRGGSGYVDTKLLTQCVVAPFKAASSLRSSSSASTTVTGGGNNGSKNGNGNGTLATAGYGSGSGSGSGSSSASNSTSSSRPSVVPTSGGRERAMLGMTMLVSVSAVGFAALVV